ncbi:hypothetical protein GE21DRAFT_1004518 [Neurospora crassa]|nr:hypothetical protein GE21DRAFT_1004518 [Neurospora crassa]
MRIGTDEVGKALLELISLRGVALPMGVIYVRIVQQTMAPLMAVCGCFSLALGFFLVSFLCVAGSLSPLSHHAGESVPDAFSLVF